MTGPEIVDGNTHAQRPQEFQIGAFGRVLLQRRGLGDLDDEPVPHQSVGGNLLSEARRIVGMTQFSRRNVDRHPSCWQPVHIGAHPPQHPLPEFGDQIGLFGDRHERPGRNHPTHGMAPAHQRLDRALLAVPAKNRLIVDLEFVHQDRRPQFALDEPLITLFAQQFPLENGYPAAPAMLAFVERQIGLRDQRVGVARIPGRRGDAHCRRKPYVSSGQRFGPVECLEHPVTQPLQRRLGADPSQSQREFISAQPADHRPGHQFLERARQPHQSLIPGRVTRSVIDGLEMIHVDLDIGHGHPLGLPNHLAQPIEEIFPVERARQRIAIE